MILKNSVITFTSNILVLFIGVTSRAILSRALGPEGTGNYTLLITIPLLGFMICNMGINVAVVYQTGSKQFTDEEILSNTLFSTLIFGVLLLPISFIIVTYYYTVNPADVDIKYIQIMVFSIPIVLFQNFVLGILQGKNQILHYNIVGISVASINLIGFILFLKIFKFDLNGALTTWFLSMLLSSVIGLLFIKRFTKLRLRYIKDVFKKTLSFGFQPYLANVFGYLVRRISVFIITATLGSVYLGYYSQSFTIGEMFWFLAGSLSTVLFPIIAASSNVHESSSLTAKLSRNVMLIVTIGILLFLTIDSFFIKTLFTDKFLPSVVPLRWLLPGILTSSLEKIIMSDLIGRGITWVGTFTSIVALIITVVGTILLIPIMGLSGVSLASTIAYTVAAFFSLYKFCQITGRKWSECLFVNKSDLILYPEYIKKILLVPVNRIWKKK